MFGVRGAVEFLDQGDHLFREKNELNNYFLE